MPAILCAGLSVAVAWLRGASPATLAAVRLRWLPLPLLAFGAQLLAFVVVGPSAGRYALWVQLAAAVLLIAFVAANWRYPALRLVAVGTLLNLAVIASNGGYMPVRPSDMARVGHPEVVSRLEAGEVYQKSAALTDRTALPWFADVIYLPLPFGPGRMLSPGDVLVSLGTFLLIQQLLVPRRPSLASREAALPVQPAAG